MTWQLEKKLVFGKDAGWLGDWLTQASGHK